MQIEIEKGKLQIDLYEFLSNIDKDSKDEFLENVACDDDVIRHVTSQIIRCWTENGYSAENMVTAQTVPCLGLDWAWREVAKKSADIAKREIERLEEALKCKQKQYDDLTNEYANLTKNDFRPGW